MSWFAFKKDGNRYVFYYEKGKYCDAFQAILECVKRPDTNLDFSDLVLFLGKLREVIKKDLKEATSV